MNETYQGIDWILNLESGLTIRIEYVAHNDVLYNTTFKITLSDVNEYSNIRTVKYNYCDIQDEQQFITNIMTECSQIYLNDMAMLETTVEPTQELEDESE